MSLCLSFRLTLVLPNYLYFRYLNYLYFCHLKHLNYLYFRHLKHLNYLYFRHLKHLNYLYFRHLKHLNYLYFRHLKLTQFTASNDEKYSYLWIIVPNWIIWLTEHPPQYVFIIYSDILYGLKLALNRVFTVLAPQGLMSINITCIVRGTKPTPLFHEPIRFPLKLFYWLFVQESIL